MGEFSKDSWEYYVKDYLALGDKVTDAAQVYTNDVVAEINSFDQQKIIDDAKKYRPQ
jgi:hypothetical protein